MDLHDLRQHVRYIFDLVVGPGRRWRGLAILLCLLNWKNLPLVWHIRFYHAYLSHYFRRLRIPPPLSPLSPHALFLPVITTSHAPLWECDCNLHKSNSTYFSDLDIARTHLMSLLLSPGLDEYAERLKRGEETGQFVIALGAAACVFRREIKPWESYEIWTRVLAWDGKWCYVVSHFVKKGAVRPRGYVMPGQGTGRSWFRKGGELQNAEQGKQEDQGKYIFAWALSKYVLKSGRKTIPPQTVWERIGLIPGKPEEVDSDAPTPATKHEEGSAEEGSGGKAALKEDAKEIGRLLDDSLEPKIEKEEGGWTWEAVEKERIRGMELAQHMGALDGLDLEFTGGNSMALGRY